MDVFPPGLDLTGAAGVVQPPDACRRNGNRVQQRHRPVLAGRVANRDIEERRSPLLCLADLQAQPDGLLGDPHEVASRRHIAGLKPLGRRAAGDHGHAIKQDAAGRGVHRTEHRFTEPRLAGVIAEQEVEIDTT